MLEGAIIALSVVKAPDPSVLHSLPWEQTMECKCHYCNSELHHNMVCLPWLSAIPINNTKQQL